jgi:hypothetical protein
MIERSENENAAVPPQHPFVPGPKDGPAADPCRSRDHLLPCPFCGGVAGYFDDDSYGSCAVGCNDEECIGYARLYDKEDLSAMIIRWNTRAGQKLPTPEGSAANSNKTEQA